MLIKTKCVYSSSNRRRPTPWRWTIRTHTDRQLDDVAAATNLGLEREGLAFIASYVASKMRHLEPPLGCPTSEATEAHLASVPSSWLLTISRGRLYVPHPWWMAVVERFDAEFGSIMGHHFHQRCRHHQAAGRRHKQAAPRSGCPRGEKAGPGSAACSRQLATPEFVSVAV